MSNQTSHTPGPWEVFESHAGLYVIDSAEQGAICKIEWCLEDEANARLIASAPEMLAVLKRLCEEFGVDDNGTHRDWTKWLEARDTIAKAEGRVERCLEAEAKPELLETVKQLIGYMDAGNWADMRIDGIKTAARAAIDKAEGIVEG